MASKAEKFKELLEKEIEDFKKLNVQIEQQEEILKQLKDGREQVRGRASVYEQLHQEETTEEVSEPEPKRKTSKQKEE